MINAQIFTPSLLFNRNLVHKDILKRYLKKNNDLGLNAN